MSLPVRLVIFDCDGVLVDSEPIALALMRDMLAEGGLLLAPGTVAREFQGRSLSTVLAILRTRFDHVPDPAAVERMGARLLERFRSELRPVPGIPALVASLKVPVCVASSSARERLRHSLRITNVAALFGTAVFSADDVANGKPAPDLFLHAASRMGAEPAECLVVEDTVPGLQAARAAGMRAIALSRAAPSDALIEEVARATPPVFVARSAEEVGARIAALVTPSD